MLEHFGKFRSFMPSLALIFHLINIADGGIGGEITEQSTKLAVKWCDFQEAHARRIYSMGENLEHEAAIRLAKKIESGKLSNPFTLKTVYDKGWHGLKDKEEVHGACEILIDENWLRMTKKIVGIKGGRPPSPKYHINPIFL